MGHKRRQIESIPSADDNTGCILSAVSRLKTKAKNGGFKRRSSKGDTKRYLW